MKSIFKYEIKDNITVIEGHIRKILCAQIQKEQIVVWAEVDDTIPNKKIELMVVGTGWVLDERTEYDQCVFDTHEYIDTVQLAGGALVFHIYARELLQVEKKIPKNNQKPSSTKKSCINPDTVELLIK
jgi:hypothetical protein